MLLIVVWRTAAREIRSGEVHAAVSLANFQTFVCVVACLSETSDLHMMATGHEVFVI